MIDSVLLRNWRSIESAELTLGRRTVLVGENGAGKSNVLAAISFVLGDSFPSSARLSTADVYLGDVGREVSVQLSTIDDEHDLLSMGFRWDPAADEFETSEEYDYRTRRLSGATRNRYPSLWIQASRSASSDLSGSSFSVFGRVQQRLHARLVDDSQQTAQVVQAFQQVMQPLGTTNYSAFAADARDAFAETVVGAGIDAELDFAAYDPDNLYRSLRPIVRQGGRAFDVARAGDGLSNLATIAVFRAAARMNRGVGLLLVEEPEAWLHPHALRALDQALRAAEADGVQVVIGTHAAELIEPARFDEVAVLRRDPRPDGPTVITQVDAQSFLKRRQERHVGVNMTLEGVRERYQHLFTAAQAEGFFARGVILVEGETEVVLLPEVCKALGTDLDRLGVSVVSAQGKTKLDQFFDLFDAFAIPVFLVFDTDAGSLNSGDNQRFNELLTRLCGLPEGEPNPGTRVEATWASVSPNMDRVLDADIDALEAGRATQLRQEASDRYSGASKVVAARYITSVLRESSELPQLQTIASLGTAISAWANAL